MDAPLNIAVTADPELPVPPLHYGGIERIVDMLVRGLLARGHDVTLFAHRESSCPTALIPWPGASSADRWHTARNTMTLARGAAAGRFDIVHSFSRLAYLLPILPLAMPKLMTYQREVTRETVARAHRLSRGSLAFTAVSRAMMKPVADVGDWHLVYNGVPLASYDASDAVAGDAPLVFLGRIERIKGPHVAIEVARRTGRPLVIAGNVPDGHRDWFEAHVAPAIDGVHVRYVGPVDDMAKNALLRSAAAFLMPILWDEPFGIVMAEAMACGTPVIGFGRGSVPEVVEDGVTGAVVRDVDGMVAAVAHLPRFERRACRARVERMFSDDAVVEGYLAVYRQLISRKASRKAG